jgi:ATP-binding cassette subfamily B protein
LQAGEQVVAWLELDLDDRLKFESGILVLTNKRLISFQKGKPQPTAMEAFGPGWELHLGDEKSVARLELFSPTERCAVWYFTAGKHPAASRFQQRFEVIRSGANADSLLHQQTVCPSCGAIITSEDGVCSACTPTAVPPTMSSLLRLLQFAKPRKKAIGLGLLLTLLSTAVASISPLIYMVLIDQVLIPWEAGQDSSLSLFWWCMAGFAITSLVAWLFEWMRMYVMAWVSERISVEMRVRTFSHLQELSLEFFGGKRTGDLMSRISSDSDRICNFLSLNLVDFINDVLMMSLTVGILVWINPMLSLITLAPFPVILWMTHAVRKKLLRGYHQAGLSWAEMTSILADTIPGIRVVKAFAQESREIERFTASNQRIVETNDKVNIVWSFFKPLIRLMTEFGMLVVYGFGSWWILQTSGLPMDDPNKFRVGALTACIAYITRFYGKMEDIILMFAAVQRAAASAHRIFEILDRVPSVPEPSQPIPLGRAEGRIELKDIRFKYGTREVLHGLNLKVEPGEMIGLVGPSGAGKSTLINLICRFYDVSDGSIQVDGHDIRSYTVAAYRRNIGIVLQDPFLFFGTIAENIAYGRPEASRAEIIQAARSANAHEFILRLPDGYDSLVGERGQSLSGGERQRISIARALLIDPRILILDEATSAVDTETEREIQAALETLIKGRTTLAIAHRLSTLRRANRLVVIEKGNIVEIGTHQELLEREGAYYGLHKAQQDMVRDLGV